MKRSQFINIIGLVLFFILFSSCTKPVTKQTDLTKYVNPFVGTGGSKLDGHGNTYPGATYPFGMVQLSPDNGKSGALYCSGYSYNDNVIAGFSHTHLSGTGAGDLADISFMPTTKEIKEEYFTQPDAFVKDYIARSGINLREYYDTDEKEVSFKKHLLLKYLSKISHKKEKASPGYYSVRLLDDDIDVELAATEFVGFHKYIFNKSGKENNVILNLGFSINRGKPIKTFIEQRSPTMFVGYRITDGWGGIHKVFFALEFKDAPVKYRTFNVDQQLSDKAVKGKGVQGVFTFDGLKSNTVYFKVGLSSGNIEGAVADLKQPININGILKELKRIFNLNGMRCFQRSK